MRQVGMNTGRTIYDLAAAFHIGISEARFIVRSAPGCFVAEDHAIMLPPIYDRSELSAWIRGAAFGGQHLQADVFAWLGHTVAVPPIEF